MCGITFPTLCLALKPLMDLREQSIVGCFPEFDFQFSDKKEQKTILGIEQLRPMIFSFQKRVDYIRDRAA